jgi:type IV secretion system protein VirD4
MQEPLNQFLNPILANATNACDFTLADLRRRRTTLYVVVPPNKLAEARKLLNIFFSIVVGENTRKTPQEDKSITTPCLLLMDEFTAMGRVDILASSISHTAGYGLRSLPIIQSLSQLDATYGADVARTFITNHGASIVFTPREQRDAEEYSKMLGDSTVVKKNRAVSHSGRVGGSGRSWTETEERRPLMLPQEIKALSAKKEIIFVEGSLRPIMADKIRYYADQSRRAGEAVCGDGQGVQPKSPTW